MRHGPGKVKFDNGALFVGYYKDGHWHGTGKYLRADGVKFQGKWYYNELSQDEQVKLDGTWYKVVLEDGCKDSLDKLSID